MNMDLVACTCGHAMSFHGAEGGPPSQQHCAVCKRCTITRQVIAERHGLTYTRESPAADPINHPPHYNRHPSGIECIDVVEHMGFNLGNAIKYIWRADLKSESPIEDLRKARWYVDRELDRLARASAGDG